MKARGTGEPTVGNGKRERPQPVVLAGNRPIGGEAVRGRQGAARDLPPRRTVGPAQGAHLAPSQLRHEEGPGDSHVEAATLSGDPI